MVEGCRNQEIWAWRVFGYFRSKAKSGNVLQKKKKKKKKKRTKIDSIQIDRIFLCPLSPNLPSSLKQPLLQPFTFWYSLTPKPEFQNDIAFKLSVKGIKTIHASTICSPLFCIRYICVVCSYSSFSLLNSILSYKYLTYWRAFSYFQFLAISNSAAINGIVLHYYCYCMHTCLSFYSIIPRSESLGSEGTGAFTCSGMWSLF